MKAQKILAILGGPHTTGMTASMLETATKAAQQAGHSVTTIHLYAKNITFCTGCRTYFLTKICVQKDDIQEHCALFQQSKKIFLSFRYPPFQYLTIFV